MADFCAAVDARKDEADPVLKDKTTDGLDGYAPLSLPGGCHIAGSEPLAPMKAKVAAAVKALIFRWRLMNRLLVPVLQFFVVSPWLFPPDSGGIGLRTIMEKGWKDWWLRDICSSGWFGLAAALLGGLVWWRNLNLEDYIHDAAAGRWAVGGKDPKAPSRLDGLFFMAIIVMAGAVLVQNGDRIARAFRASAHCVVVEPAPALGSVQEVDPASPCVQIEQVRAGVSYGIALEQIEPFVDWHIPAPVGSFASAGMLRRWSEGRRRAPEASWFAPLVPVGMDAIPQALALGAPAPPVAPCLPKQPFLARFTADRDGPLFFFVNDLGVLPAVLYNNDSGDARLVVCQVSD